LPPAVLGAAPAFVAPETPEALSGAVTIASQPVRFCATPLGKAPIPPIDDAPAIYLIRDGRSAIVSYFHYLNDIQGLPATLEELIRGEIFPGFWADHYKAWNPQRRPGVLFLRYEELTVSSRQACNKIAGFLRKPAINDLKLGFAGLHERFPAYFRCGDDKKNIAEIEPHQKLFDSIHGDVMRELGYY